MQLISNISRGLKPLTIAAGLLATPSSATYADIDMCSNVTSVITNDHTSKYICEVDNREESYVIARRIFKVHLETWQDDTLFLSSIHDIIAHKDFQSIVAMGKKAVPFIIEEIDKEPSQLVWALNLIYNKKITNKPNTSITEACKLWVKMLRS